MSESTPTTPPAAPAAGRSSLFGKLIIGGFVAAVLLTECLLAYFLIPSADEVARRAEARMTEKIQETIDPHGDPQDKPTTELDLGEYKITSHQSESSTTVRIDFKLFGVVLEEEQAEMLQLFERHQHRFRDQVIFEVRNASLNDLSDPGLGLIKRRILEKSNRLLGKPILQSIVFSDFSFVEQ